MTKERAIEIISQEIGNKETFSKKELIKFIESAVNQIEKDYYWHQVVPEDIDHYYLVVQNLFNCDYLVPTVCSWDPKNKRFYYWDSGNDQDQFVPFKDVLKWHMINYEEKD